MATPFGVLGAGFLVEGIGLRPTLTVTLGAYLLVGSSLTLNRRLHEVDGQADRPRFAGARVLRATRNHFDPFLRLTGMKSRQLTALLVLVILVAACGDSDAGDAASLDGAWELRSATVDGREITLLAEHRVTATISGDEIGGRAACNQYGATIEVGEGVVSLGEMSWTAMACEPPVMEVEQAYMGALSRVSAAKRSGSALVLSGEGVELEYALLEPVPTADLVGVTWMLSEIVIGEAVTSPAQGADDPAERAMLVLNEDGTMTGHTGCRGLTGEYQVSGDEVVLTSLAAEGECIPELQWQDNQVISVLEGGFSTLIDGRRLTVTASGGEGLVFRAGP